MLKMHNTQKKQNRGDLKRDSIIDSAIPLDLIIGCEKSALS